LHRFVGVVLKLTRIYKFRGECERGKEREREREKGKLLLLSELTACDVGFTLKVKV